MTIEKLQEMRLQLNQAVTLCSESDFNEIYSEQLADILYEYYVTIGKLSFIVRGNAFLGGSSLMMYFYNGMISHDKIPYLLADIIRDANNFSNKENISLYLLFLSTICLANAWMKKTESMFLKQNLEDNNCEYNRHLGGIILRLK